MGLFIEQFVKKGKTGPRGSEAYEDIGQLLLELPMWPASMCTKFEDEHKRGLHACTTELAFREMLPKLPGAPNSHRPSEPAGEDVLTSHTVRQSCRKPIGRAC